MGECLISRRGGEAYKLPILDTSYPQDITVMATPNGTASFSIAIAEHGKPTNYTYQWYVNGKAVSGAINANYIKSATANDVGTYTVYCDITNKAGTVTSRIAKLVVKSTIPTTYSYSGVSELKKDSDYDWTLYLKSSGTLVLEDGYNVDIFLQGGGAGGVKSTGNNGGAGGTGGYQTTMYAQKINKGSYDITIGAGGAANSNGGSTSAFNYTAGGGGAGDGMNASTAGTGVGGKGGWYWDGGNSGEGGAAGSNGKQAFNTGDVYYGAGGAGGNAKFADGNFPGGKTGGGQGNGGNATANTGSGGGGGGNNGGNAGTGGSGIVIIRNKR